LKSSPCTEAIKKYRCKKAKEVSMKDLIIFLKNQERLKCDGFHPYGWWRGKLLWSKQQGSVTRVIKENEIKEERVFEIDSINAILI